MPHRAHQSIVRRRDNASYAESDVHHALWRAHRKFESELEQQAHIWFDYGEHIARNLARQAQPPRMLTVHYDTLMREPDTVMAELLRVAEHRMSDEQLATLRTAWSRIADTERAREAANSACIDRAEIERIVADRCKTSPACALAGI